MGGNGGYRDRDAGLVSCACGRAGALGSGDLLFSSSPSSRRACSGSGGRRKRREMEERERDRGGRTLEETICRG
jgi:hypothetical protein